MPDYSRLQWSINFKPRIMKYFADNRSDIQEFTRDAVYALIEEEEMKKKGYVKKYVKEEEAGR